MDLPDVAVLVHAHRRDAPDHARFREWIVQLVGSPRAYGISELVLSRFISIVTHPRIFREPSPLEDAATFASQIRDQPHCVLVSPGPRHWDIYLDITTRSKARGNLSSDAYLAAMAIESGCEWVTTDGDYARFPELRWRHPLA
jgi:toxin-antitoxin system PIN domain toxin